MALCKRGADRPFLAAAIADRHKRAHAALISCRRAHRTGRDFGGAALWLTTSVADMAPSHSRTSACTPGLGSVGIDDAKNQLPKPWIDDGHQHRLPSQTRKIVHRCVTLRSGVPGLDTPTVSPRDSSQPSRGVQRPASAVRCACAGEYLTACGFWTPREG